MGLSMISKTMGTEMVAVEFHRHGYVNIVAGLCALKSGMIVVENMNGSGLMDKV